MKKESNKYKLIVLVLFPIMLFSLVIFLGIGYSSFETNLGIDGSIVVRSNNDVRITNISVDNKSNVNEVMSATYTSDTIGGSVNFIENNSYIIYNVTVTNLSSDDLMITNVTAPSWTNENVNYSLVDFVINETIIPSASSSTFKVKLLGNASQSLNFILKFEFYKMEKYALNITSIPNDAIITYESNGQIVNSGTANLNNTFEKGTLVKWTVSKEGYASQSETETMNSNITKTITLLPASNYTFAINPTPNDSLVTISSNGNVLKTGYGVQSIEVSGGTVVNYNVSKYMYSDASGDYTVNENHTINVTLESLPPAPNYWYTALDPTLLYKLRRNETISSPLTVAAKNISTANEAVLASTDDEYGTTYYYRGAVTTNYVSFANMCWRITRITGNGAIKMTLYNNSDASCTTTGSKLAFSGTTTYNSANSTKNNAYEGLMFGSTSSGTTYLQTHENINKSDILKALENWYKSKFLGTSYESKLADVVWCNDKDIASDASHNGANTQNTTDYAALERLVDNRTATLVCTEANSNLSRFTVNDTTYGNGKLDYKIGLLSGDEIAFAGAYASILNPNSTYFLYQNTGAYWWSISPYHYKSSGAKMFTVNSSGALNVSDADENYYIRPTIALNHDVEIVSGTGTADLPYVIN